MSESIGIYLINLNRSIGRLTKIWPKVSALNRPITRIEAIDGAHLLESDLIGVVDYKTYKTIWGYAPNSGTIGCALSHLNAWNQFIQSNYDFALILEDDVDFDPTVLNLVMDELIQLTHKWDIVNFDSNHGGTPLSIHTLNTPPYHLCVYLTEIAHAGGYLINKTAAIRLAKTMLPIRMAVDRYFTRGWDLNLSFMGIEPRIVRQTYGDSNILSTRTITHHSTQNSKNSQLPYKKHLFRIKSYGNRFFYNLILFIQLRYKK